MKTTSGLIAHRGPAHREPSRGSGARRRLLGLAVLGAVVLAKRGDAQDWSRYRLSVRPHEMATGTRTTEAGQHLLDSLPPQVGAHPLDSIPRDIFVYVPQACVGTRRCPLLIYMATFPESALPMADKYGILLLSLPPIPNDSMRVQYVDAAFQRVLRKFAVDPDRIAIGGHCAHVQPALFFAIANPDVFKQVIGLAGGPLNRSSDITGPPPTTNTIEFRLNGNIFESFWDLPFRQWQWLHSAGYRVSQVINLNLKHSDQAEDWDFMGRWLQERWAMPNPAPRAARAVIALDSLSELTVDVLARMTAFWERFQQEPDSIRTTARQAHLRELVVPVVESQPVVIMVDMQALAAQYPSVAADLKAAGLTAKQHEAYRAALVSAQVAIDAAQKYRPPNYSPWPVQSNAPLAKNTTFLVAHPDEIQALEDAGMWSTP